MLYFRYPRDGERIPVCLDDARLIPVFGKSHEQGDNLAALLDLVIESEDEFVFDDAKELDGWIRKNYVDNIYLSLDMAPIFGGTPVTIIMQGNRGADAAEADRKLAQKLRMRNPPAHDGFTWHHKEDIRKDGSSWKCNMYLVESGFHRRYPHRGGVYMYECYTGKKYT